MIKFYINFIKISKHLGNLHTFSSIILTMQNFQNYGSTLFSIFVSHDLIMECMVSGAYEGKERIGHIFL